MPVLRPRAAAVAGLALLAVAAPAWAAWTTSGAGVAAAASRSLVEAGFAPGQGASVAGQDVTVSWTDGANPAGTTHQVARNTSPPVTLACTASPCTDAAAPAGTYSYTVTPRLLGWTGPAAETVEVTVPAPATLVPVQAGTKTAGTAFELVFDSGDPTITGTREIAVSGLQASPAPASTAPLVPATAAFTDGRATLTVTAHRAETSTITVAVGQRSAGAEVTVAAAAPALLFSQPCSAFNRDRGTGQNGRTDVLVTRNTDTFANPVADPNAGAGVTATYSSGGNGGSWSAATRTSTSDTFALNTWQNPVTNGSVLVTPTVTAPGYVSASCSYLTMT